MVGWSCATVRVAKNFVQRLHSWHPWKRQFSSFLVNLGGFITLAQGPLAAVRCTDQAAPQPPPPSAGGGAAEPSGHRRASAYCCAAKIAAYRQQYADNQNISFLPAIVSTSTRMHGEFLRLLFLQAHRETEAHFTAAGMSSQTNNSEALRFKRAACYNGLKSKVGLAAKAAELRINLNVQGCGIVATPMHAPSRTPLLLPVLLSHNLPIPRVH
jgi:hypothetical protein